MLQRPEQAPSRPTLQPQGTPILAAEAVTKRFGGQVAVDGMSFTVEAGEILGLVGPNGAGKTTMFDCLAGSQRPTSGRIAFAGRAIEALPAHARMALGLGRTFQIPRPFGAMSVLDNVLTGLTRLGRCHLLEIAFRVGRYPSERREFRQQAEETIGFLEIGAYRDTVVGSLPYGLQKRVEMARALVASPKLLLLDEPMAGMNADEKADLSRLIREVNRVLGTTVVLIEHDIGVVMGLSHHVVVLDYGRKVGDGTPEDVRRNPDVVAAYLGTKH